MPWPSKKAVFLASTSSPWGTGGGFTGSAWAADTSEIVHVAASATAHTMRGMPRGVRLLGPVQFVIRSPSFGASGAGGGASVDELRTVGSKVSRRASKDLGTRRVDFLGRHAKL